MKDTQSVVDAAVKLSDDGRLRVVEVLLESFEPSVDDDPQQVAEAWRKEIRRRSDELRSGNASPIPWSEIHAEGERLLNGGA